MSRACGHVEGRGHHQHLGSFEYHQPGKLGEAEVKADAKADFSPRGVKDRHLISGGKGVRLLEALAALDIDVKQMHFPVAGHLVSLRIKHKGSVVNLPRFIDLRDGAAHQPQLIVLRHMRQSLPALFFCRLGIRTEIIVGIRAVENFREHGDIGSILFAFLYELCRTTKVFVLVHSGSHLDRSDFHAVPPLPFCAQRPDNMPGRRKTGFSPFFISF